MAGLAWVVCEVAGGLAFLAAGARLWRYHLLPLWSDITSPIVWMFAATLIIPLSLAFERRFTRNVRGLARLARVAAFVAVVGPVLEVLINELGFKAFVGQGLYTYTVLATFDGSGSWLSPFYYLTLLVHVPITDRILGTRVRMSDSRYLYRGVSAGEFISVSAALTPRATGPFVATPTWGQFPWGGVNWGESKRNAVVRHQWQQRGLPTSGVSTTPSIGRAGFYALSGGKSQSGYVLVVDRAMLARHDIEQFTVSDHVVAPAVPNDAEVILVSAAGEALPAEIVVDVIHWPVGGAI